MTEYFLLFFVLVYKINGHYRNCINLTYLHTFTRPRTRHTIAVRRAQVRRFRNAQGYYPQKLSIMDLFFIPPRICWWRVLFLLSIFQDYLSNMLDCPPTCSCSPTEIYCNKSDNGKFFPLLALQDTGNNGNNSIEDVFKNITSM